ncbi:hypothetical protein LMG27952_05418 [Paraburkholderia hiiakae]|uniref:Uncharacterized protein n=1 Tax=Paraburkholderia hiiakae TaxID=1081782 RepID=A0ABN7I4V7_9BURK|nr:hypothetical protein [Paraburkholderia hiiakae]CAD6553277.1 hypothetical protein LMG27952_05418 [Paraburkholderia hiiakae]
MTTGFRLYRGLEIYPLVYPHRPTMATGGRNYEEGFDAAVRIQEPESSEGTSRSRVFRLAQGTPFQNAGDARRASTAYAVRLIDTCPENTSVLDLQP